MPRTIAVDCPGCPPIRALTFDVLGLIKVTESRSTTANPGNQGAANTPKIVEKWGEPDAARCIVAASINDRKSNPLLAVARKNGHIELLNPLNGDVRALVVTENATENPITGLHLFKKERSDVNSRTCTVLTCAKNGQASLRTIEVNDKHGKSTSTDSPSIWNVCAKGDILCSAVDGSENHALFGGKGVEVNLWELEKCSKIWTAKSPPKNSLDIFTPTWFTASTFLSKDDHRKIVAGTNDHQVRLYDISAQRRPVISFDFRESPIKAVSADLDGHAIYFGTGAGDLASVDIRTGKLLGVFLGKSSGSIRSIVRHPELPVIVSCGLDCYLRFWDVKTRQLLSAVYLKQHLTNVVFDSNFSDEVTADNAVNLPSTEEQVHQDQVDDDDDDDGVDDDDDEEAPSMKRKSLKDGRKKKKISSKKRRKKRVEEED